MPNCSILSHITNCIDVRFCYDDNEYFTTWLGYDPRTEEWTMPDYLLNVFEESDIEAVLEKSEYRGVTIYLHNLPIQSQYSGWFVDWAARWYDSKIGAEFTLAYYGDSDSKIDTKSYAKDGNLIYEQNEVIYVRDEVMVSKEEILEYAKMIIDANR